MTEGGGAQLASIVQGLYRGALTGNAWEIEGIRGWVGAEFASICLINAEMIIHGGACSGLTESDRAVYLDRWAEDDLIARRILDSPSPVCHDVKVFSRGDLQATPVFAGFYEPRGIAHQAMARAPLPNGHLAGISVQNGWTDGPVAPGALRRAAVLTAHLARAIELSATINANRRRAEAADQILTGWGGRNPSLPPRWTGG